MSGLKRKSLQRSSLGVVLDRLSQCLIEKDTVGGETGAAGSSRCLTKGDTMANGAMLDERKP